MSSKLTKEEVVKLSPAEMRAIIRRGEWTEPDEMAYSGYWKANMAILSKDWAYEFMLYAQRNPQPCWIGGVGYPLVGVRGKTGGNCENRHLFPCISSQIQGSPSPMAASLGT